MSLITVVYLVLLLLGALWVGYRVIAFLRTQKERDAAWHEVLSPEELKAYLETVKQNAGPQEQSPESESLVEKKEP
jgi:hypothetical protein